MPPTNPHERSVFHGEDRPVDAPETAPEARACPVCGGRLVEIKAKVQCSRCRTIYETCCEGGRG